MLLGRGKKTTKSVKVVVDVKEPAAKKLQCMVRVFLAKIKIRRTAKRVWQRVYDPTYKRYFWYNNLDGESKWKLPKFVDMYYPEDHEASELIQKVVRGFVGRMKARKLANQKYTRYYDAKLNKFYWLDKSTQQSTWHVTPWLERMEVNMPPEDQMLFDSQQKIRELEALLKAKEEEIKEVRKKRFEELEPEVIRDKVKNAKVFKRSKNMDEWKTDELAAWFTELKMEQYIPFLFQNRVDGLLFINLSDDEWADMGITNKFHIRKLQLILKSYRVRYQRKRDKIEINEEDDLLSEISPSELSDMINAENQQDDYYSSESSSSRSSYDSEEELDIGLTEEQKQQKQLDAQNVSVNLMVKGDGVNFPMIGDIVRVRYVASLTENGKVVMSTKNVLGRPWVEFVLGIEQVIKGFDRALPLMSVGERSTIIVTPEYAYGKEGLPPHIPPNSSVSFDLTLLGFRARTPWVKPLIQDLATTNERPYHADLKVYIEKITELGLLDNTYDAEGEEDSLAGMKKSVGSPKLRLPSVTSPGGSKFSR